MSQLKWTPNDSLTFEEWFYEFRPKRKMTCPNCGGTKKVDLVDPWSNPWNPRKVFITCERCDEKGQIEVK